MTLSEKTKIEWRTVAWLLAAAVSYGMLYQRVDGLGEEQKSQGRDIAEIKSYLLSSHGVAQK